MKWFILLSFLAGCSMGVVEQGGDYAVDPRDLKDASTERLAKESHRYIKTLYRDPPLGKREEVWQKSKMPIKKIGIVIFEGKIQSTFSGYAEANSIYLNETGKQLMVEKTQKIWEESFPLLAKNVEFVAMKKIMSTKAYKEFGTDPTDYIKTKRTELAPDDIFYLEKGKYTTQRAVLTERRARDYSQFLVPATQLMSGPKFSQHQIHLVNSVAKELGLDAVLVVYEDLHWKVPSVDKYSKEVFPEELSIELSASLLVPFTYYHKRLDKMKIDGPRPRVNACYRSWEVKAKMPIEISIPRESQNFDEIQSRLLTPLFAAYTTLTQMMIFKIDEDIKSTH